MAKRNKEDGSDKQVYQSPEERGAEYLNDHPNIGFSSVIVCSDNAVFFPTLQGANASLNHARTLKSQERLEVFKNGDVKVYTDENTK